MKKQIFIAIAACMMATLLQSCGAPKVERMPIYVEPFYNSSPFKINVGEYSERLMSDNKSAMLALSKELKQKKDETSALVMYVLAVRLYDLGAKDEAVYWFYTAQIRKNIFLGMAGRNYDLDKTLNAFHSLAGQWINGYAAGVIDNTVATLDLIAEESKDMGYIAEAYRGKSDFMFKGEEKQAEFLKEQLEQCKTYRDWLDENREDIARQRKENGIEGKY